MPLDATVMLSLDMGSTLAGEIGTVKRAAADMAEARVRASPSMRVCHSVPSVLLDRSWQC